MIQTEETLSFEGCCTGSLSVLSTESSIDSLCPLENSPKTGGSESTDDRIDVRAASPSFSTSEQNALANLCINTIRFLCVDAINNANSGHPGICMGMAAAAFVLFDKHMKLSPSNPLWLNRDRFVLSAGHGSMLLYSILHLYGYSSMSLEDVKNFRRLNSKTPGHPECTETPGVEVCTGPLGQGICNAVGIALSEAHVASVYNRPGFPIVDNFTYCIAGDGCMMEGLSGEACSLAGHIKLGKLIVLYDDNHISIDGSTDLAFTEDVSKRFEAYGWQVLHVEDGNTNIAAIDAAIHEAKRCSDQPSLIKITTTIGFGAPNKENTAGVHGAALGNNETQFARKSLSFEYEPFEIPSPAMEHFREKVEAGNGQEEKWQRLLVEYRQQFAELSLQFDRNIVRGEISSELEKTLHSVALEHQTKSLATRKHSRFMLNNIALLMPTLIGGSADLSPSTLTDLNCSEDFTSTSRTGRIIRFGVREHAMGAISNGISLAGYNLRPFCSTFLVFSDYMRAAMRMASLSKTGTLFIMTHDSVGVGEDGPSHQPIEHLASLRAMPNHDVWRPADAVETGAAYARALEQCGCPSTLVFSRQSTAALLCTDFDGAKRGGYVLEWSEENFDRIDGIIIATGSEVGVAVEAANQLNVEYGLSVRVVSLPCWEEFQRQDKSYRKSVLCVGRERTVSVEAASRFGWERFADHHVSVEEFGKSGNGKDVLQWFGVSVEGVMEKFMSMLQQESAE